jgi:hypothetical protein
MRSSATEASSSELEALDWTKATFNDEFFKRFQSNCSTFNFLKGRFAIAIDRSTLAFDRQSARLRMPQIEGAREFEHPRASS